ncbi:MAG: response regulator [Chloroflexi bacterium]|nr:response regulator [Chloroflexota bacterium]
MSTRPTTKTDAIEILIAEDSPTQAMQLKYILEEAGYRVAMASDGREALALIRQRRPTLVITDIIMPEMDGYQLCEQIKSDAALRDTPVIVLTALSDAEDVIRAVKCGTDSFITKPYDEKYLVSTIQNILTSWPLPSRQQKHMDVEVELAGRRFIVASEHLTSLSLLLSTYEAAAQKNRELIKAQVELRQLNRELEQRVEERTAALMQEIVERKRTEAALRASEEKFAKAFHASPNAMAINTLATRRYLDVNNSFTRLTGYSREEVIGRTPLELGLWPRPEERTRIMQILQEEGAVRDAERQLHTRTGEIRDCLMSLDVVEINNERYLLGIVTDITERKRMQEKLIVTDRLASLGELAAGIAHEVNNPLTSISGFAQLLLSSTDLPEEARENIRIIYKEAERAAQVVRNLLGFARRHDVVRQPVNINDIIDRVLEIRAYEQKVQNIAAVRHCASDLPSVMGDFFQLQQVFLNIIINAEYFMLEAHNGGTLTITTERAGNNVRIAFADDGPGISPQALGHIFDPFFTTKLEDKGTGLGLSICHGIVAAHGGEIHAESVPGRGATFIIELPVGESLE